MDAMNAMKEINEVLLYLRQFSFASTMFRLLLAMVCGGLIGLERGKKHRAAGFRTYMLVSLGAALTMILGQYEYHMLTHQWSGAATLLGIKTDVSRFGAQVINGVGFLGAGTVIVTGRQQVKGLTTAAGLWASACMGLACGAGFFECVSVSFVLILLSLNVFARIEDFIVKNARNMNVFIEFDTLDDVGTIISMIKSKNAHIYEVDIDHGHNERGQCPSAVFSLQLARRTPHTEMLSALAKLDCARSIEET